MMLDATLEPVRSRSLRSSLAHAAVVVLVLGLLPGITEAQETKDDPEEESQAPTKASDVKPTAAKPVAAEAGVVNPEEVDWQTVPPGEKPPPPKKVKEIPETPWSAKLSLGSGLDTNSELAATETRSALLSGLGLYAQTLLGRNIRVSALGVFETNPTVDVPAASEAGVFAGYMRELPSNLQLRVSNFLYYARERSVFADGTVLLAATTLQTVLGDNLAALLVLRKGPFDLEFGTQGSFESHAGRIENSRLFGIDGIAALRYTFRDRLSFRVRYSYEFSNTTGLSSRNLAGGVDFSNLPLKVGVHRIRSAARARITTNSQIVGRYDRVYASDDFSGFLNSREDVAFLGWVAQSPRWTFEGDLQYAKRFFTKRIPTIDNPNQDTVWTGTARIDFWALVARRLGLFAMYRYEKASANPTGLLFERHVGMAGVTGRFGNTP